MAAGIGLLLGVVIARR
ncbi:MAG: hypothetical protein ACLGII_03795 [Gammaproteobacteria bacterium]